MFANRLLLIITLTVACLAQAHATDQAPTRVELDGPRARALAVAFEAFRERQPEARLEAYSVHVHAVEDGLVQVVFEPRLAGGARPTPGGRTAAGAELNVWVRLGGYTVERVSFAR